MKKQKKIMIDLEVYNHINENNFFENISFSDWVEETYKHQFMRISQYEEKIGKLQKEIEKLKEQKEKKINKINNIVMNSPEIDHRWIINAYSRAVRSKTNMNNVLTAFNTKFEESFSIGELEDLIEEIKKFY